MLDNSEFIELFKKLPDVLRKTKSMQGKDEIVSKIFLNFTLKDKKVASYQLNQPFKDFMDKGFVLYGRGSWNRTSVRRTPCAYLTTRLCPEMINVN